MTYKRIQALFVLACTFFVHLLSRLFAPKRNPVKSFHHYYADEGIWPKTSEFKEKIFAYSQCLNCSLCDFACPQDDLQPSQMMASWFRNPQSYYLLTPLDAHACEKCKVCEDYCPHQIPITSFITLLAEERKNDVRAA